MVDGANKYVEQNMGYAKMRDLQQTEQQQKME